MSPNSRRQRVCAPLLVGAVMAVSASCGEQTLSTRADGLGIARYEPTGSGGNDGLLTGVVDAQDGCLMVRSPENPKTPYVPIFASNDDVPLTLAEGDNVELGGGGTPGSGDWDIPAACPSDGPFWLVRQP